MTDRDQSQQDREAFEARYADVIHMTLPSGKYMYSSTQHAFGIWQAALAYERGKSAAGGDVVAEHDRKAKNKAD